MRLQARAGKTFNEAEHDEKLDRRLEIERGRRRHLIGHRLRCGDSDEGSSEREFFELHRALHVRASAYNKRSAAARVRILVRMHSRPNLQQSSVKRVECQRLVSTAPGRPRQSGSQPHRASSSAIISSCRKYDSKCPAFGQIRSAIRGTRPVSRCTAERGMFAS